MSYKLGQILIIFVLSLRINILVKLHQHDQKKNKKLKTVGFRLLFVMCMLSISLPNIMRIGLIVNFKINQSKIAQFECREKSNPNNCCKGSCKLNESLQSIDHQTNENSKPKQIPLNDGDLYNEFFIAQITAPITTHHLLSYKNEFPIKNHTNQIDHPPS